MAKAKNPLFSEEASGALGGIQFSRNQYGNIVGRRSISPHVQTQRALTYRALLKLAHTAWADLTQTEKDKWSSLTPPPQTPRNFYVACYLRRMNAQHTLPEPAPVDDLTATFSGFYLGLSTLDPLELGLGYSYSGGPQAIIIVHAYYSAKHLRYIKPDHYKFAGAGVAADEGVTWTPPFPCKHLHLKLELCHSYSARVAERVLLHYEPTWE